LDRDPTSIWDQASKTIKIKIKIKLDVVQGRNGTSQRGSPKWGTSHSFVGDSRLELAVRIRVGVRGRHPSSRVHDLGGTIGDGVALRITAADGAYSNLHPGLGLGLGLVLGLGLGLGLGSGLGFERLLDMRGSGYVVCTLAVGAAPKRILGTFNAPVDASFGASFGAPRQILRRWIFLTSSCTMGRKHGGGDERLRQPSVLD